eukprot:jgi/Mesvir1/14901/Mv26263-RA.1
MWPEGAPPAETGAPAAVAGPSRSPAVAGPSRPPVAPAPSAPVQDPTPVSVPAPSAPRSLAAVVRASGIDHRSLRAADSLRELSQGNRERAPSVVHAMPESRDSPVPGYTVCRRWPADSVSYRASLLSWPFRPCPMGFPRCVGRRVTVAYPLIPIGLRVTWLF